MKFEDIRRSLMLVAAIRIAKKSYRRGPLWALVMEICGTGSTTACAICRECGWDPDQDASKEVKWNPDGAPHPGPLPRGEGEAIGSGSGVSGVVDGGAV
jgi:hypothetical protein